MVTLMVAVALLLRTNLTIMLTAGHLVLRRRNLVLPQQYDPGVVENHSLLAEVLFVASLPLGGLVGVIVAGVFTSSPGVRLRSKETLESCCVAVLLGSLVLLVGLHWDLLPLILLGRFVAGLGEVSTFVATNYLARASSDGLRPQVLGAWEAATATGLLLGPVLSSVLDGLSSGEELPGVPGIRAICLLALWLLGVLVTILPTSDEMEEEMSRFHVEVAGRPQENSTHEDTWIGILVPAGACFSRMFGRCLCSQLASLMLTAHFCLDSATAGWHFVGALVFALFIFLAVASLDWDMTPSDDLMVRGAACVELLGSVTLLLLPRSDAASVQSQPQPLDPGVGGGLLGGVLFPAAAAAAATGPPGRGVLIIGLMLYHTGSCLGAAPLASLVTNALGGVTWQEHTALFCAAASQAGMILGGVTARAFSDTDVGGLTMALLLLPVSLLQISLVEVGFGGRKQDLGAEAGA